MRTFLTDLKYSSRYAYKSIHCTYSKSRCETVSNSRRPIVVLPFRLDFYCLHSVQGPERLIARWQKGGRVLNELNGWRCTCTMNVQKPLVLFRHDLLLNMLTDRQIIPQGCFGRSKEEDVNWYGACYAPQRALLRYVRGIGLRGSPCYNHFRLSTT